MVPGTMTLAEYDAAPWQEEDDYTDEEEYGMDAAADVCRLLAIFVVFSGHSLIERK